MDQQIKTQDQLWQNVLSNAFYLNYPGLDGANTEYDPLRPLYPLLKLLNQKGAVLTVVKKSDGTKRLKLEQGGMNPVEWNQIRTEQLPRYREKLMWLFAVSILGGATEAGAKETERLFGQEIKKCAPDDLKKRLEETGQLNLFGTDSSLNS